MNGSWSDWIAYGKVPGPKVHPASVPIDLTEDTMLMHRQKVLERINRKDLDCLLVYGDREHGANFGYLAGFEPRFEEAVIVLHRNGTAHMLLGNESLRMAQYSRIPVQAIHVPYFSLPNQPMETHKSLVQLMGDAGICAGMRVGIAGWKLFTSVQVQEDNTQLFDVPHFIVSAVQKAVGEAGSLVSAGDIFIHPREGARILMNANEIAHYEFGASLAAAKVYEVLQNIEVGKSELELADGLHAWGQPITVQTICATGERFTHGAVAPRDKKVALGDQFSVTMGLRGGLTSRSAYVVSTTDELNPTVKDYVDRVAGPYFAAAATWYQSMVLGTTGDEIYRKIDSALPKAVYGWELNPGHLTAGEEWLCSPISKGSDIPLQSGMLLQMDIIPKVPGYGGAGAEDGIALADRELRQAIADTYPDVWRRIQRRREYMQGIIGIKLSDEVLPLSDTNGYFRPYILAKDTAFHVTMK